MPILKKVFQYSRLALLVFLLSQFSCRKNSIGEPRLPPITQEGKNTFGCKINGQVWVPYYSCRGLSANPCGEIAVNVYQTNSNNNLPLSFSLKFGRDANTFSSFTIETKQNFGICTTGNKIDSVKINYLNSNGGLYYNYNYYNRLEKFEITKLDLTNKIISGTFEVTLYESQSDSLNITDGRFDLRFNVCKCSN